MILEESPSTQLSAVLRERAKEQRAMVAQLYESITASELGLEPSG
jgi:hypothetical protein